MFFILKPLNSKGFPVSHRKTQENGPNMMMNRYSVSANLNKLAKTPIGDLLFNSDDTDWSLWDKKKLGNFGLLFGKNGEKLEEQQEQP